MKELDLEKAPKEKIFYIGVSYTGNVPWAILSGSRESLSGAEVVYTVKIPYRL